MNVVYADLWSVEADVRCVTTNGTVRLKDHSNIMGGGCAREAAERYPWLPTHYGRMIEEHGHHVFLIGKLVMFPTKWTLREQADLGLIERSCDELESLADVYGWKEIALPAPGCGLGGLLWKDVTPILASHPRFTIVRYPGEETL